MNDSPFLKHQIPAPPKNGTRHWSRKVLAAALGKTCKDAQETETGGDLGGQIGASHSVRPPPERIALTSAPPAGTAWPEPFPEGCQGQERFSSLLLRSHRPRDNGCEGELGTVARIQLNRSRWEQRSQGASFRITAPSRSLPPTLCLCFSLFPHPQPRFYLNCVIISLNNKAWATWKSFFSPKPQTKQNKTTKCPESWLIHTLTWLITSVII